MPELKTLSTPYNTYDSFPDKTARAQLGNVDRLATESKESTVEAINEVVYKTPLFIKIIETTGGEYVIDKTATEIASAIDEQKAIFAVIKHNGTPTTMSVSSKEDGKLSFVSFLNGEEENEESVNFIVLNAEIEYSAEFISVSVSEKELSSGPSAMSFDLAAMGLPAIPTDGTFAELEVNPTEIIEALAKGPVAFVVSIDNGNGTTSTATVVASSIAFDGDIAICTCTIGGGNIGYAILQLVPGYGIMALYRTAGIIPTVTMADNGKTLEVVGGVWSVAYKDIPPTAINMSDFESEGRIVETFADGSTKTTVMEFDADGKPVKITDSNGNVTVLTW